MNGTHSRLVVFDSASEWGDQNTPDIRSFSVDAEKPTSEDIVESVISSTNTVFLCDAKLTDEEGARNEHSFMPTHEKDKAGEIASRWCDHQA